MTDQVQGAEFSNISETRREGVTKSGGLKLSILRSPANTDGDLLGDPELVATCPSATDVMLVRSVLLSEYEVDVGIKLVLHQGRRLASIQLDCDEDFDRVSMTNVVIIYLTSGAIDLLKLGMKADPTSCYTFLSLSESQGIVFCAKLPLETVDTARFEFSTMDRISATVKPFLPKSKEDGYANINTNDEDNCSEPCIPERAKTWRPSTLLSALLKLTIISLALHSLITLSITIVSSLLTASLPPCYCGASVSEALSLNCKFDSLSTSWLPPHCRDDELTALFERAGPGPDGEWTYYRTQPHLRDNLTAAAKYTVDELALLSEKSEAERQVVATVEWHDKHCFFLLLKMVRGKARRMGYTGFPEVLGHAEHCAMSMVQGVPGYYPIIGVVPGFGDPL